MRREHAQVVSTPDPDHTHDIHDLITHPTPYLRLGALARYWGISRSRVLVRIKTGALPAVRLGPRLWRVPVEAARAYERRMRVRTTMLPFRRNEAK